MCCIVVFCTIGIGGISKDHKINIKCIALIPARKGSKGLANKCVYPLNGKPLVSYTIEAALDASCIDDIYVSTDSEDVKQIAKSYGVNIIDRPKHLAKDEVGSDLVVRHAIEELGLGVDNVLVLLQPTSPLRTARNIAEAMLNLSEACEGVYSVTGPTVKPLKAFIVNGNGFLEGLVGANFPFKRRQDLAECYYSNGAIYAFRVRAFLSAKNGFDISAIAPYIMNSNESIDIDTYEDIVLAENLLQEINSERV